MAGYDTGYGSLGRGVIETDRQAWNVVESATPLRDDAEQIRAIALACAASHSFVDHQTYPRSTHPNPGMRLSELFSFAAVITSLRTTLGIEMGVTRALIEETGGNDEALLSISREVLTDIVRPAGLANNKASYIIDGVHALAYDDAYAPETLKAEDIEGARKKLLKLKGVGAKAVDCFMLLGLNLPVFPVDINVFKLVSRTNPEILGVDVVPNFGNPNHTQKVKEYLEQAFAPDVELYQTMHTYLLLAEKYKIAQSTS